MDFFLYFIAMIGGSIQYEPEFLFWIITLIMVISIAVPVLFWRLLVKKVPVR
jgi:hypothetical protein